MLLGVLAVSILPSPQGCRKDLLEHITGCTVKEGLFRPQKRSRGVNTLQQRYVQLHSPRSSIDEHEDAEHRHDGDCHSDDDGDAYQIADDHHDENDTPLEEGVLSLENEPQSREAQQRNSDQGWENRRGDVALCCQSCE